MITNMGGTDRAVRTVAGVAALIAAFLLGFDSVAGIVLAVVAAVMFVTATVGFCPLYRMLGVSTCRTPAHR
jgi:hypothetical protein